MENKKFIRTVIICMVIIIGFLSKNFIISQIKKILNPPPPLPEYMSEHVPETRLEYVPEKEYYIEIPVPPEEVKAKIEDVKAKDHKERVGLKNEMKDINRKLKRRPTKELYKKRADMLFKEMYVYRDLKKTVDFTSDFVKATDGDNHDWKSSALAGMGFILMGEYDKAQQYLHKSISIKANAAAYYFLSELRIKQRNYAAAWKAINRSEELFKSQNYEPLTVSYGHEDIRPFAYDLNAQNYKDRRLTIEGSIEAIKEVMHQDPNYKTTAIIK